MFILKKRNSKNPIHIASSIFPQAFNKLLWDYSSMKYCITLFKTFYEIDLTVKEIHFLLFCLNLTVDRIRMQVHHHHVIRSIPSTISTFWTLPIVRPKLWDRSQASTWPHDINQVSMKQNSNSHQVGLCKNWTKYSTFI